MNTILEKVPIQTTDGTKIHSSEVALALLRAGQHCYTPESVANYRKKVKRAFYTLYPLSRPHRALGRLFILLPHLAKTAAIIFCVMVFMGIFGTFTGAVPWLSPNAALIERLSVSLLCFGLGTLGCIYLLWLEDRKIGRWERVRLLAFSESIPEKAELTIREIERFYPKARERMRLDMFQIDEVPDPILSILDDITDKPYYLEVWNEPNFDALRVKAAVTYTQWEKGIF